MINELLSVCQMTEKCLNAYNHKRFLDISPSLMKAPKNYFPLVKANIKFHPRQTDFLEPLKCFNIIFEDFTVSQKIFQ